jgi:hypothetical protein
MKNKIFKSGAERSEQKLPLWMIPIEWKIAIAKRFAKGWPSYGIGNCYKAIGTGDLDFIREFYNHAEEHLAAFRSGLFGEAVDGESPLDHLGALMWNAGMLLTYSLLDYENVKKAFDQHSQKKTRD